MLDPAPSTRQIKGLVRERNANWHRIGTERSVLVENEDAASLPSEPMGEALPRAEAIDESFAAGKFAFRHAQRDPQRTNLGKPVAGLSTLKAVAIWRAKAAQGFPCFLVCFLVGLVGHHPSAFSMMAAARSSGLNRWP